MADLSYRSKVERVKPLIDALRGTNALAGTYRYDCPACKAGTVTLTKNGPAREHALSGSISGGCDQGWCVRWRE